ncbi:aromatic prenyltransferase [Xylaria bambusicola]|uniref:aromatic prenyltransferase n=1 Tax=Xylaria bambusicola TaxID=326684 RepID=UPI0020073FD4|nr:aromatic prenyltransferase [Xylaria bambusicola]KAI0517961.1 aromatic prenyltransferase [Xylaria bambusicola]
MMSVAEYPEEAQRQFLSFLRDTISPQLGCRPDSTSGQSGMAWDGSPIEYSFELKGSSSTPSVRFVIDLAKLRPLDSSYPLSIMNTQNIVDELSQRIEGFNDIWYQNLVKRFTHSDLASEDQKSLAAKTDHQSSIMIGFDIHRKPASRGGLPVMGKVYFLPCFAAAHESTTRWQVVRSAIRQLPGIDKQSNILRALSMIEEYLAEKPRDWEDSARYLATDFVKPGKARLKLYLRAAGGKFEEVWDYYTLGGRITGLDEDKEKFRELVDLTSGRGQVKDDARPSTHVRRKATTIYFSLSADSPYPAPKICIYPASVATSDESILRGLDAWLMENGMNKGGVSMEDRLKCVL